MHRSGRCSWCRVQLADAHGSMGCECVHLLCVQVSKRLACREQRTRKSSCVCGSGGGAVSLVSAVSDLVLQEIYIAAGGS